MQAQYARRPRRAIKTLQTLKPSNLPTLSVFQLTQFLKFFIISPISWMLFCLLFAIIVRRRWLKISHFILSIILFFIFTNPAIATYTKYRQAAEYARSTYDPHKTYDVAIVLGGFSNINPDNGSLIYLNERADRLWEAIRLYKLGKVKKILITGDPATKINEDGNSHAEEFFRYMQDFGIPRDAFIIEPLARNTRENVALSLPLVKDADSVLLITSAIHMRRALKNFHDAGLDPDYLSVTIPPRPANLDRTGTLWEKRMAFFPSWSAATDWQEILNELAGRLL